MKLSIGITVISILAIFLRVNLPTNEISTNIAVNKEANVFQALIFKGATTQLIADWQIKDFLVFKTACSNTLKMSLIAVPFKKWHALDKDIEDCN